mgnify:FL=1|jgi:hypothetical protein
MFGFPKPDYRGSFKGQVQGIKKLKVPTGKVVILEDPETGENYIHRPKMTVEQPIWFWTGSSWIPFSEQQENDQARAKPSRAEFLRRKAELKAQGVRFR